MYCDITWAITELTMGFSFSALSCSGNEAYPPYGHKLWLLLQLAVLHISWPTQFYIWCTGEVWSEIQKKDIHKSYSFQLGGALVLPRVKPWLRICLHLTDHVTKETIFLVFLHFMGFILKHNTILYNNRTIPDCGTSREFNSLWVCVTFYWI